MHLYLYLYSFCFNPTVKASADGQTISGGLRDGPWLPEGFFNHDKVTEFENGLLGNAQEQLEGESLKRKITLGIDWSDKEGVPRKHERLGMCIESGIER